MKSSGLGKNTSQVEVQNISKHGLWLYVKGSEYFLSYKAYPWFKSAKVAEIYNIKLLHGEHLHWPDLDIDLEIDAIQFPERYPLTYR